MLWLWHLTYFLLVGLVRAWQGLGWLLKRCRWVYNWLDFVKHWVAHVPNRAFMTWLKHNDSAEVIVVGGDLAGQEILATIIYNLLPCISVHSLSRLYDITWYYSVQVLCIMSLPLSSLSLSLSLSFQCDLIQVVLLPKTAEPGDIMLVLFWTLAGQHIGLRWVEHLWCWSCSCCCCCIHLVPSPIQFSSCHIAGCLDTWLLPIFNFFASEAGQPEEGSKALGTLAAFGSLSMQSWYVSTCLDAGVKHMQFPDLALWFKQMFTYLAVDL